MSNLGSDGPSKMVATLRMPLEAWVKWDCAHVVPRVQQFLGVLPPKKEKKDDTSAVPDKIAGFPDPSFNPIARLASYLVHSTLLLATELGNEIFYVTAFPFVFWNISCKLGIQLVLSWLFHLVIGQWVKDVVCLPRPWHINPKVNPMGNVEYALEYGFPSTHVISVLSHVAITRTYIENHHPGQLDFWVPILYTALGLLAVSRVYMGVHSTPDLVGAAVLSKLILYVYMPFNDLVQPWVEESTEALYVPFVAAALVLWYYPRPTQWAVSFGDTAIVSGVASGVVVGRNIYGRCHGELGRCDSALLVTPTAGSDLDALWWLKQTGSRFLVGAVMVAASYYIIKPIVSALMLAVLPESNAHPKKRYAVEGPVKFFSYGGIGFTVVTACPLAFRYLGFDGF